jgi:hypothetical protein
MDFDIENHGFQSSGFQNVTANVSEKTNVVKTNQGDVPKDTISKGAANPTSSSSNSTPSTPLLLDPKWGNDTLNKVINSTIKEYSLPSGKDLAENLSDETKLKIQEEIRRFVEEGHEFDLEMKRFFDLLSKLYPFSLALLSGIFDENESQSNISDKTLQLLNELGKLLGKNIDSSNLPEDVKAELKQIAEQLANMPQFSGDAAKLKDQIQKLLQTIQNLSVSDTSEDAFTEKLKALVDSGVKTFSFDSNAELFQKLQARGLLSSSMLASKNVSVEEMKLLLGQLQSGKEGLLQNASSILNMLGILKSLPQQEQMIGFSTHIAMQNIRSPDSAFGLLGASVDNFTDNIGKFINDIRNNADILSGSLKGKEGEQLFANAFKQTILSASILGNMIAARAGKEVTDDTITFSLLKLQSSKELGIVDQIPFSFMAFFADLSSHDESLSDAILAAKQSLLQLVRILLKLIFVLAAIATAGQKLGPKAMDRMLLENSDFLTRILDSLIFALKKVDENYVVSVNVHIALAQAAKDCLAVQDYEQFWTSIIHMFSPKTELALFLKDMEEAKPLFKTLESMLSESEQGIPAVSIPLSL